MPLSMLLIYKVVYTGGNNPQQPTSDEMFLVGIQYHSVTIMQSHLLPKCCLKH